MNRRETADEIEEGAARWVWRLDREARTPQLEAELDAWLAGDTRRQGAFLQAEAAWAMLDRGSQLADTIPILPTRTGNVSKRALLAGSGAALAASLSAARCAFSAAFSAAFCAALSPTCWVGGSTIGSAPTPTSTPPPNDPTCTPTPIRPPHRHGSRSIAG